MWATPIVTERDRHPHRTRIPEEFEGRDSSLISAGSMGTLEFSSLYPFDDRGGTLRFPGQEGDISHTQFLTFTRDDPQDPTQFSITRGYKFYTGGAVNDADPELQKYSKDEPNPPVTSTCSSSR